MICVFDTKRWADAEANYLIALEHLNKQENIEWRDLELKTVNLFLGRLYLEKINKPRKAIPFLRESLRLSRGDGNDIKLSLLEWQGLAYEKISNLDEAVACYEEAIVLLENELFLTRDNNRLCRLYRSLAGVFQSQNRLLDAEEFLLKAIQVQDGIFFPDLADKFESSSQLMNVLRKQRKYGEASKYGQWCLEFARSEYGPASTEAGQAVDQLAMINIHQGDWRAAEDLLKSCLKAYEATGAVDKDEHFRRLMSLSSFFIAKDDLANAITLNERAVKNIDASDVMDQSQYIIAENNLAMLYASSGMTKKAEGMFGKILKQSRKELKTNPLLYAQILQNIANNKFFLGDNIGAEVDIEKISFDISRAARYTKRIGQPMSVKQRLYKSSVS